MQTLIKNATIVNEQKVFRGSVLLDGELIKAIGGAELEENFEGKVVNAEGLYLLPGMIDDQVHFREPGLTHKADIFTESRAAVAGGITSHMEMPNTIPNTLTQELLEKKYARAAESSVANYSFFMGASNDNLDEVMETDPKSVCGIKIFMGSSTGNMLVDNRETLREIFSNSRLLIATHCEDEATIRANTEKFRAQYGEDAPVRIHPQIRNAEACYRSSSMAVEMAEKYGANLHVLHVSTAREMELFRNDIPLEDKRITAEACVHHLWFTNADYDRLGTRIKWNPAVKSGDDRAAVREAVTSGRIDILATDHAPHTLSEKQQPYFDAPSGGPLVQHALPAFFDLFEQGVFSLETIVQRACHAPAIRFKIDRRGFIRPGYFADLVLVKPEKSDEVNSENILYKCGWSPFEGHRFSHRIAATFVNGRQVYDGREVNFSMNGKRLTFDR